MDQHVRCYFFNRIIMEQKIKSLEDLNRVIWVNFSDIQHIIWGCSTITHLFPPQCLFVLTPEESASVSSCSISFCSTSSACLETSLIGTSQNSSAASSSHFTWSTPFLFLSLFYCRMCEYVDHLHEHFVSPVVIHDAHYVPPKVRWTTRGTYGSFSHLRLLLKACLGTLCSLFSGSRIFLWDVGVVSADTPVPWRRCMEDNQGQMMTFFNETALMEWKAHFTKSLL